MLSGKGSVGVDSGRSSLPPGVGVITEVYSSRYRAVLTYNKH